MSMACRSGVIPGIALAALALCSTPAEGQIWPMFHGDSTHAGRASSGAPFDSMLAWTCATGDTILFSSPVVAANGTIYVGNAGKHLVAIAPNGRALWTFDAGGNLRYSTPAIAADGTIYVGGSDAKLYAVNPDSTLRWTFSAGGAIKSAPCIGGDGTVYFGADDGKLYALRSDSALRWSYQTGDSIRCSPALGPDGSVFFGSMDGYFYALWPGGGLRWRVLTGGPIKYCSPVVDPSGLIYFGSYDGLLYAVTVNQQFLWAYDTGHVVRSSPAIGPDGRIFVGGGNKLLALLPDGSLDWEYDTGGTIMSSPVYFVDDDVICVGSDDGALHCVHDDGSGDWTYTTGAPIRTSPAPSGTGNIVVADLLGRVWAFGNPGTGGVDETTWSLPAPQVSPNPCAGRAGFRQPAAPEDGMRLSISDAAGRSVTTLAGAAGFWSWDTRDARGLPVPAGVYFYRLAGNARAGRLVVVR